MFRKVALDLRARAAPERRVSSPLALGLASLREIAMHGLCDGFPQHCLRVPSVIRSNRAVWITLAPVCCCGGSAALAESAAGMQ